MKSLILMVLAAALQVGCGQEAPSAAEPTKTSDSNAKVGELDPKEWKAEER